MIVDVSKQLRTDLLDAYLRHHEGDPEASQEWMELNQVADRCGYVCNVHTTDKVVSVSLIQIPMADSEEEEMYKLNRELYFLKRSIEHNDPCIDFLERWEPNAKDQKVMADLGIRWDSEVTKLQPEKPSKSLRGRRRRALPSNAIDYFGEGT